MNKLLSLLKNAPKRTSAAVLTLASAIIIPATLFAYGPVDRATFTYESPATYPTFNSITNNPSVGDERNFVRIKDAADTNAYAENVNVQAGHTYKVMVFYHNNAASNLNDSGAGIAKDVTLRMQMAANVNAGASTNVTGFINSSNATPKEVWDSATLTNTTAGTVDLSFVAGSAKVTSNGPVNGATLPDSLFTTGTNLGYDSLNGVLKGCNQYSGYVIFDVKVNQPNFTVQKQVSVDEGKTWTSSATTTPGSTVQYRIIYTNTGTTKQTDVTVKDTLPQGISYVPNSTQIVNSVTNGKYEATSEGITTTGLNIGAYLPAGNAALKFSAKVADAASLACGTNTLNNVGRVTTPNGYKESTAVVTVNKTCNPPTTPVYTCNAVTVTSLSAANTAQTKFRFNATYTAQGGATFKNVTYIVRDSKNVEVARQTVTASTLDYERTIAGKYSVEASMVFTVSGVDKTVSNANCKANFEVTTTSVPPVTPPELPHTGPTETILGFLGLGAIVASLSYFIASRRAIRN